MTFDYKKEYKEFYAPKRQPVIIEIPPMQFAAVRGTGDPNEEGGAYQAALNQLYGIVYTLKMSYKGDHQIEGYFKYVVPPLEGLWWQEGIKGVDYTDKAAFQWISMIRLPEFITKKDFQWAKGTIAAKKKTSFDDVIFFTYDEGVCVQCMHIGPYDDESATVEKMDTFAAEQGYTLDFATRYHHEIYLSDPRRAKPENLKTIIRHPIKKERKDDSFSLLR